MPIKHLPQHLINKLKAGEIVERPASIVKELVENSLDAWASDITVRIEEGGKTLIKVQDNGTGISADDLPLALARYATSKISRDEDLEHIASYGFRGEALAAIAEVSTCTVHTRTTTMPTGVGYALTRVGGEPFVKQIPFAFEHGTIISIENLFHDVPVRQKFLKTATTERHYIRQLLLNYLLLHRNKNRQVWNNGKLVWKVAATESLLERILALTNAQRQPHLHFFEGTLPWGTVYGMMGDASLHFPSQEQMRFFVNERPVDDKILKKAVMQISKRQLPAGLFPFLYLFVQIDPGMVDVNVHPRKTEVKFLDPGSIFSAVTHVMQQHTGEQKVSYAAFTQAPIKSSMYAVPSSPKGGKFSPPPQSFSYHHTAETSLFDQLQAEDADELRLSGEPVQIVGQLWQMYILAASPTGVYLIDQHALAERIAFEAMKSAVAKWWFVPQVLLQPIIIHLPSQDIELHKRQEIFEKIGIDASAFWEAKMIVHTMPQVFIDRVVDIQLLANQLRGQQEKRLTDLEQSTPQDIFATILEEMQGMKACKASITAGQQLTLHEMRQLVRDGQSAIPQMFVCQHGRPSIVKIDKSALDQLVGR
jgi:DNA mismatch repair protein MutL